MLQCVVMIDWFMRGTGRDQERMCCCMKSYRFNVSSAGGGFLEGREEVTKRWTSIWMDIIGGIDIIKKGAADNKTGPMEWEKRYDLYSWE
jgi:hypothetical protein